MRGLRFFLGVIAIASLSGCAATQIVTPEITCPSVKDVIATQPNCEGSLLSAINNPTKATVQEALWCCDRVIQHWEDAYDTCVEKVSVR